MENKFTDAKWITDDKQVKDLNKFTNVTIDDGQLKDPKQIFSELLKKIRTDSNKTIPEFADLLGIKRQMLSHYENGDYYPNFDSLMQILKKLNVSISYLTGESNTQVNEIAKINIAEYTGLSEEAIDNLHLTKFLNEYYGKSMSSATDVEESREGKRPYYYYISALLSETSPHGFESFENDLEYYCKASRQLRETELLYNKAIERKDKMEEQYNKFDRKTNGLLREYRSVFELINDKIQNPDDEYFYLSEDFSVNYGDLSIEEIIEKQSELEEKIIKILHMPKVKEFVEEYIKVQNECMHYFSLTETLKNRKARAFMNIIETLDNLSKQ